MGHYDRGVGDVLMEVDPAMDVPRLDDAVRRGRTLEPVGVRGSVTHTDVRHGGGSGATWSPNQSSKGSPTS